MKFYIKHELLQLYSGGLIWGMIENFIKLKLGLILLKSEIFYVNFS